MCSPLLAAYEQNHPIARIHITQQQQQDSNFQTVGQSLFSSSCPIVAMGRQRNLNISVYSTTPLDESYQLESGLCRRTIPKRLQNKTIPKQWRRVLPLTYFPIFSFPQHLLFCGIRFLNRPAKYHKKAKRLLKDSLLNVHLCIGTQFLSSSQIKNCLAKFELSHIISLCIDGLEVVQ